YQTYRVQPLDAASYYSSGNPFIMASNEQGDVQLVKRNARAWIYSVWGKLLWRKLSIEAEFAGIYGAIQNPILSGSYGAFEPEVRLIQEGGALNAEYKFLRDALTVRFLFAFATGDPSPGWGVRPLSGVPHPGDWDGSQAVNGKDKITNFRFDPD